MSLKGGKEGAEKESFGCRSPSRTTGKKPFARKKRADGDGAHTINVLSSSIPFSPSFLPARRTPSGTTRRTTQRWKRPMTISKCCLPGTRLPLLPHPPHFSLSLPLRFPTHTLFAAFPPPSPLPQPLLGSCSSQASARSARRQVHDPRSRAAVRRSRFCFLLALSFSSFPSIPRAILLYPLASPLCPLPSFTQPTPQTCCLEGVQSPPRYGAATCEG